MVPTLLEAPSARDAPGPLRIALVSDTHTTRGREEDQAEYQGRFDRVIASVNGARVDLVLVSGDLTQGGKPAEVDDFRAQSSALRAPVWVVPGNHDVGDKRVPGREGGVTAERVATFEQTFGPSFWSRTAGGVRVMGLVSPLLGSGLPREADQWAFLETELAGPSAAPTLVVMHDPPFLESPDEPGGGYWNVEPAPRARLLALLRRGGVRAVLTGHVHRPLAALHDSLLLYATPPVSFGLPRGRQPTGWTLVTVSPAGTVAAEFRPTDAPAPE